MADSRYTVNSMLNSDSSQPQRSFASWTFAFLIYNVVVILWGAWVRISFSGDGCGNAWPLCAGEIIPQAASAARWIEWSHRASTGLFGIFALTLCIWGFKLFPPRHPNRKSLLFVLLFTFSEALIGALLVKLELVGQNASLYRAWVIGIHQINSLCLTSSIFITYFNSDIVHAVDMHYKKSFFIILSCFAFVSFTGALAALAGTLFPSFNLIAGFFADLNQHSPILVRLRLAHPLSATLFCTLLLLWLSKARRASFPLQSQPLFIFLLLAFAFGVSTLLNLSPLWMKITHLALTHILVMFMVYTFLTPKKIIPF